MLIKKTDIGGEIISILTRGMYLDPKDALREYIQNGVDADAKNISVKIRHDVLIVTDDGNGMDSSVMRKAIRVGISDKNPTQSVGFMGIGIYSAFHLCDKLDIYSHKNGENPGHLSFNFKLMREKLNLQREKRLINSDSENTQIALQDLLEETVDLIELSHEKFPKIGTRVELSGIDESFFKSLSQFEDVSQYLQQVIPLHFDPEFKYGRQIDSFINTFYKDRGLKYHLINLELHINEVKKLLFRPYTNELFYTTPLEPKFYTLKHGNDIFGISWACLNGNTSMISNKSLRGFIIKKNGFTIGNNNDLLTYFLRQTYYNRYVGEVIITHPKILPNAARSEFEYSPYRTMLQNCLMEMAKHYNKYAEEFQEETKADAQLEEVVDFLKKYKANLHLLTDNKNELLAIHWKSKEYAELIRKKNKAKRFNEIRKNQVVEVISQLEAFSKETNDLIQIKTKTSRKSIIQRQSETSEELDRLGTGATIYTKTPKPLNLREVFEKVGFELNKELTTMIDILDEGFVRLASDDENDYRDKLQKLLDDFEYSVKEF